MNIFSLVNTIIGLLIVIIICATIIYVVTLTHQQQEKLESLREAKQLDEDFDAEYTVEDQIHQTTINPLIIPDDEYQHHINNETFFFPTTSDALQTVGASN